MYNTSFVMCGSVGLSIIRLESNGNRYRNNVNGNYYRGCSVTSHLPSNGN